MKIERCNYVFRAVKSVFAALVATLLFSTQTASAAPIGYDIVFYQNDFATIPAYSGSFVYDDATQFVSGFTLDMNLFGGVAFNFGVPAGSLHLGNPPGTAFDSALVASLTGGDAGICANGCNAVFNEANVFAIMDDVFNVIQGPAQSPATQGYYQILPSAVPEPLTLTLMLLSGAALLGSRRHKLNAL